jgi:membrane-bound serine protease (ClpP class)
MKHLRSQSTIFHDMKYVITAACACAVLLGFAGLGARAKEQSLVQVVRIDDTIDAGMAHRVQRAVEDAKASGARAILAIINTNGGAVDDANDIKDALSTSGITTIAYVSGRAWSAGALISLACDKIYMAPGSSIGAAEPVLLPPGGAMTPASEKVVAALRSEMISLAEAHHRNPDIAAGMVDPNVVIPNLKTKGQILSLSAKKAVELKIADGIASSDVASLEAAGISGARLSTTEPTLGERIAQFVSDPIVSGLLLTIGFLGLLIEMQTLHLVAGVIGVLALALFFGGHIIAGASTWVIVALFGLGVLALLFELHVLPGHGISGLIGALLILSSIVMAFGAAFWVQGLLYTSLSLLVAVVLFFVILRWLPESAFLRRLAFAGVQTPGTGYTAVPAPTHLLGKEGTSESLLRPVGVAMIDGVRYQVQTAGDFIPPQTRVVVSHVDGGTIFVTRVQS